MRVRCGRFVALAVAERDEGERRNRRRHRQIIVELDNPQSTLTTCPVIFLE